MSNSRSHDFTGSHGCLTKCLGQFKPICRRDLRQNSPEIPGPGIAPLRATSIRKVMKEEASVAEVASTILNYLRQNPEAQDTFEGIVNWWLPDQQHQQSRATIKEALDRLLAAGLIREHKGTDGQISYRVMRDNDESRKNL